MENDRIAVTAYTSPDLDGFACAIAYAEWLNKNNQPAETIVIGTPTHETKYLMEKYGFRYPVSTNIQFGQKVILVDSSDLNGISKEINPRNVIEIIDHRKINDSHTFPNAKIQIELVGAAATLVAERFVENKTPISEMSAMLLYGAIISNTLNFKANVTTERDHAMAQWLASTINPPTTFAREMFTAKSDLSGDKLQEALIGDFAWFNMDKKKVGIAQLEIMGGEKLIAERKGGIERWLEKTKIGKKLDLIMLSIIDLEKEQNIFFTNDEKMEKLLSKTLNISFAKGVAIRKEYIMRKEMVPIIKKEIEEMK